MLLDAKNFPTNTKTSRTTSEKGLNRMQLLQFIANSAGLKRGIYRLTCSGLYFAIVLAAVIGTTAVSMAQQSRDPEGDETISDPVEAASREAELISKVRQLTFEGRRAGEGYFSADGKRLVFQSEREPGNPFFQIYLMDLETGDINRISPGYGKTTCAWIHPQDRHVLFASTHEDANSLQKQADELKERTTGREKRYAWDFDDHYDLFVHDSVMDVTQRLTFTKGYDAEGSYSPDGQLIVFASNRRAYTEEMTEHERELFEHDPATLMDIYIMRADGTDIRQLTDTLGYDGGPFFSPDAERICWRRFSENGAMAEIMTMRVDGSDQRQITRLGALSWAPYYHPSGQYIIFATNRHGFANFELYMVDVEGKSKPVRVTYTKRFDGLPVFTPDGKQLAWTSSRTSSKRTHIFLGNWNHTKARELLGLGSSSESADLSDGPRRAAARSLELSRTDVSPQDIMRHVDYLCRPELTGRLTGTPGEQLATAYVAACFDRFGMIPAGDDGSWFQPFDFTSGVSLGSANRLEAGETKYVIDRDWRPVAFSQSGAFESAPIVFAGYGIAAPGAEEQDEYDSYVHLDVHDKWVMVFRDMPGGVAPERRQHLRRHSSLRYKTMLARDKGARGLLVVSGPNGQFKNELVKLRFDGTLSGSSLPVISVTDAVAAKILAPSGKELQPLQDRLDTGEPMMGFRLDDMEVSASIDIQQIKRSGRNVLGRLPMAEATTDQTVIVGAHIDHLGQGAGGSSLARDDEQDQIHFGADDNASGVAAMLEIAEYLAGQKAAGKLNSRRDILFAAWSGEELGLLGASHFVKDYRDENGSHPHSAPPGHESTETEHNGNNSIYPSIAACINMDMVGRLKKNLVLQGVGSSSIWPAEIERRNAPVGLSISAQDDSYIPTDASVFFMRGVPILSAFTGSHEDYHTPRDTPDKLNYEGAAKVAKFMALVTRSVAMRETPPDFIDQQRPKDGQRRANLRAWLGTIPDYGEEVTGVKLSGVGKGGPADKAGVRGGDVIVELAGRKIDNIYDYTYAIEALKIGQQISIVVLRNDKRIELKITPESRE